MIYARQIAPEWQESPIFLDGMFPESIVVTGNRDYISRTTAEYDRVLDTLESSMRKCWKVPGNTAINAPRKPPLTYCSRSRVKFSTGNIHALKGYFSRYGTGSSRDDKEIIARVLSLVTGQPWQWSIIRGCCQSDWQEVFYPVNEWGREALAAFEVEYFNTGSEWIVHEGEFNPEQNGPEDIEGHSIYCTSYKVQEEIAAYEGVKPEEVKLFEFSGFSRVPVYKAV